jgi:Gpi18-like mannosyltransferase
VQRKIAEMELAARKARNHLRRIADDEAVRWALGVFLSVRVSLSALAIVITILRPLPELGHERYMMSLGLNPVSGRAEQLLLEVWQRWDVIHYQRIAAQGYTDLESSVFPPLFPALTKVVGTVLGGHHLLAALLVSNLCFLVALVYFFKLTQVDYDREVARRATLYLAIFPTAFFFFVPYSESLFFLLVMLFFYAARHQRWAAASVAAGLAAFTRVQGLVLIVPLSYEWLRYTGFNLRRAGSLVLLIVPVLIPPAAFVLSRHLVGYPPLSSVLETYWHTTVGAPWHNFANLMGRLASNRLTANDLVDAVIALPFLVVTLVSLFKSRLSYSLYSAATLAVVTSMVYPDLPLMNLPRHWLLLFPTFIFMAVQAKRPNIRRCIVYSSAPLLLLLTGMFVQWLWVA